MIQKVANSIIVVLCLVVVGLFGLRLLSSRDLLAIWHWRISSARDFGLLCWLRDRYTSDVHTKAAGPGGNSLSQSKTENLWVLY